jgi:hypothetical protein
MGMYVDIHGNVYIYIHGDVYIHIGMLDAWNYQRFYVKRLMKCGDMVTMRCGHEDIWTFGNRNTEDMLI